MPTSLEWRRYFEQNARSLLKIPWERGADLTPGEVLTIESSLKEFQAGERSEGKHLLQYAREYAEREGDQEYVNAVCLLIAEEQRHARDLGRFLTVNGIRLTQTTFTDRVFRRLRRIAGNLEVSISVLITAEIIAKVYYVVLKEVTSSVVLRCICDQILSDELRHVEFQAEQLCRLRSRRGRIGLGATIALQRILYLGTVPVVWIFHHRVIRRGGLTLMRWWQACWSEFNAAFAYQALSGTRPLEAETNFPEEDSSKNKSCSSDAPPITAKITPS